jgi:glycosyltransferase involved in cell wall biosynthesis
MTTLALTFQAWVSGLSGGDRHLLESAARWKDHVDISVIAPPAAVATIRSFLGDVPIEVVGARRGPLAKNGGALALEYIRRAALAEVSPPRGNAVVAASHFLPDAANIHAAARAGIPGFAFVYHLIEGRSDRTLRTTWSRLDERLGLTLLARSRSTVFSSNRETHSALGARGFEPSFTNVGLDLSTFHAAESRPASILLFMARLVPKKGLSDFLEALPAVVQREPRTKALVVGDGPSLGEAKELAARLGIQDSIKWLGFVAEEEKRRLLASSTLLVAPSYEEGWGIAVAEAMASKLPVVAYRLSVLDEVFGDAYSAVPLGSREGLSTAILQLLQSPAAAARLAEAGRVAVEQYDVQRVAEDELETILRKVTG